VELVRRRGEEGRGKPRSGTEDSIEEAEGRGGKRRL
jgi:hypothetical protein